MEKERELDKVIQQPHQSVSEYAQCKIAKAIEVGVGREDLGLHRAFINHLASDRIKRDVHRKFEKTTRKGGVLSWEELVEKAKEEESYYKGPMDNTLKLQEAPPPAPKLLDSTKEAAPMMDRETQEEISKLWKEIAVINGRNEKRERKRDPYPLP